MPDGVDPGRPVDPTDLGAVADVLYRVPPAEFIARRTEFVKAAKAAGGREVAAQVKGLGRPTRAAWVLNLLARDAPDVVDQLVELGAALAAAQRDLDAATLRELSDRRRALVREVSRQAFGIAGDTGPSAALATEVQDTLTAAVVDPSVGEALRGGALLKAAQASGFGPAGPELASVPPPRALRSVSRPTPEPQPEPQPEPRPGPKAVAGAPTPRRKAAGTKAPSAAQKKAEAAAEREAEQARRAAEKQAAEKRARIAAADRALAQAREALDGARAAEAEAQEQVRILRDQVRAADRALGDAGLAVREARAAVREAEKARRESR